MTKVSIPQFESWGEIVKHYGGEDKVLKIVNDMLGRIVSRTKIRRLRYTVIYTKVRSRVFRVIAGSEQAAIDKALKHVRYPTFGTIKVTRGWKK